MDDYEAMDERELGEMSRDDEVKELEEELRKLRSQPRKYNVPLTTVIERIWIYEAKIVKWVDGDTTQMDVDHGCNVWTHQEYVRYAGINAPEIHGPSKDAGIAARNYLTTLLSGMPMVYLATVEYHEEEKFGRLLAVVFTAAPSSIPWAGSTLKDILPGSVNQEMIDSGNAVPYDPSNL